MSFFTFAHVTAQDEIDFSSLDESYREDQFYFGMTLNFMTQTPSSFSQNGLSGGFQAGFIRDIPLNQQRNIALGIGMGYGFDVYNSDLFLGRVQNGNHVMLALNQLDIEVDRNRFLTHAIEFPIQFRWRTSSAKYEKFYRIYGGINIAYTYHMKSFYRDNQLNLTTTNTPFLNKFRTGAHLALGHGFINFYIQYYFDSLLKGEIQNNQDQVNLEVLKFGLMFYIL